MTKFIFNDKTDHCEGLTASDGRQSKLRYLFWIPNCQRIRNFFRDYEKESQPRFDDRF